MKLFMAIKQLVPGFFADALARWVVKRDIENTAVMRRPEYRIDHLGFPSEGRPP